MKITAIETHVCNARMRNWIFVKVLTDQPGLWGWGEATLEWHTRSVVGAIEDLAPLLIGQDPTRVDIFADMGVRIIQLTYNLPNQLGDGAIAPEGRGLTDFGRQVVDRLNARRVMVDLSHSGRQICLDAARYSKQPISINHTGCRALTDLPRNKTDEELRLGERDPIVCWIFGDLGLSEAQTHITPHSLPCAPVPEVVPHDSHGCRIACCVCRDERVSDTLVPPQRTAGREAMLQRRPTGEAVLTRERELHIGQGWRRRCIRQRAEKPSPRVRVVRAKRLEPALCFFLEVVEGCAGRELSRHADLPSDVPVVR